MLVASAFAALLASPGARAQAPLPPEAADAAACLCLKQAVAAVSADMNAKTQALDAVREELARLNERLQSERSQVDVNNPESVARYKQLLERRDAAFGRLNGRLTTEAREAASRYGARASEFNSRCANRPFSPVLLNQVQATLSCPSPY